MSNKRDREEDIIADAPPRKALKVAPTTDGILESLYSSYKIDRQFPLSDLLIIVEKRNKSFYKLFERKEKIVGFKNMRIWRRFSDNTEYVVVSFPKTADWQKHHHHSTLLKKVPPEGYMFCETKTYVWFQKYNNFFDILRSTNDDTVLYNWFKKCVDSLYCTFEDVMLEFLHERSIVVNDLNEVVFYRYPFLEMDDNANYHKNVNHSRLDTEKLQQLATIARMARNTQPRRSQFREDNASKFAYTVTALIAQKWSVYLGRMMNLFVDDNNIIVRLSNYAYERKDIDRRRLQQLANRVAFRRSEFNPNIMDQFVPQNHSQTEKHLINLDTCHSLKDFFHHLWDYRTQRKVAEISLSELSERELAELYLENVPLYRFSIFEEYSDVLYLVIESPDF